MLRAATVGIIVIVATTMMLGTLIRQSASSSADSSGVAPRGEPGPAMVSADGAVTEADGVMPDGVTVFDEQYPGVVNLHPDLLYALRTAATDAAEDGTEFIVNSGWRSSEYQDQLLDEAVATYGSAVEAARWVATADTSAHVSGDAVDIGAADAAAWLSQFGARYGLCPLYDNEPWHFELRPDAPVQGCPATYADPTQDPRMQQ
jgi:D-alanyl-D-alanine carboxypeptidase